MKELEPWEIIEAHVNGAKIEMKNRTKNSLWHDCDIPIWNFADCEYRVKERPNSSLTETMKAEIMKAHHIDGVEVQRQLKATLSWRDWSPSNKYCWDFIKYNYRVKPKDPVIVELDAIIEQAKFGGDSIKKDPALRRTFEWIKERYENEKSQD